MSQGQGTSNPDDAPTPVEVCATVASGGDRTLAAHREEYARVTKSDLTSGALGGVCDAVERWIAGAPRETYWTGFPSAAPGDEVFDVAFPVA
ncbi:hypothetical protein ACQEVZ_41110 [Dactylosporangium sp. CA-152071]|uniref:hypothetical protein n=1 Tax=Dactylosporangium sp. CA-152071 TaxID=3239933 RepID=UPI003D8E1A82